MARELQETPRSQRLIHLGAVVLASGGAAVAFGRIFIGHTATLKLVAVVILSVAVAAAFERRSPLGVIDQRLAFQDLFAVLRRQRIQQIVQVGMPNIVDSRVC